MDCYWVLPVLVQTVLLHQRVLAQRDHRHHRLYWVLLQLFVQTVPLVQKEMTLVDPLLAQRVWIHPCRNPSSWMRPCQMQWARRRQHHRSIQTDWTMAQREHGLQYYQMDYYYLC